MWSLDVPPAAPPPCPAHPPPPPCACDARCVDGGRHEYPAAWLGVRPPPCQKCGRVATADRITVTV